MTVILASQSAARRALLQSAGVSFEMRSPMVDEDAAKQALRAQGISARDLADALAELKAIKISKRSPGDLVIGCDQTLSLDDGSMIDKAATRDQLRDQLLRMSGRTHDLWSAVVVAENGTPVWRNIARCRMSMRSLSPQFIDHYLESEGDALLHCVGGYRFEGLGIQLFNAVDGSHDAILGLPLLPLLEMLRLRAIIMT